MDVEIPYGKKKNTISTNKPVEVLLPKKVKIKNENKIIKEALEKPIDMETFEQFAYKSDKILVIVNDATRPTPTAKILEYLSPILTSHPHVKFLIATGVHRPPDKEELKYIFGKTYNLFKNQIIVHNARNEEETVYLGKSKNETEMYINKLVPEYENVVVIGSVEPHYFAGYTGGRKSFLPGVASYKTIEMNHKLALSDKACSLALKENPVHEDMVDAMNVLKKINVFSIQTILTKDHEVYAATAGDLHKSFDAAIEYAKQIFCAPLKQKGNIVITAAPYPMDVDLYQSQKALDNGKLALEDEGIIILVSKCRTGVGEEKFLDLLESEKTCDAVLKKIGDEYKLGYHKAAKMAQIGTHAEMWAVTDLDDPIIKKAHLKPYNRIQKALKDAIKKIKDKGKQPQIVVMPYGSLTIPFLKTE
ncbi:MAG: nickel-dependent lactate racemase [Candidatus Thermoplasmatota archaeon]